MKMFSLEGRVAFVTGSSRGLGYAMAAALGKAGAKVAINARDPAGVDAAVAKLRAAGISAAAHAFDVSDEGACKAAIAAIERDWGKLDILVNNAGINFRHAFLDYPTAEFEKIVKVHLTSAFVLSREAARGMVARKHGRIIMTSSAMARVGRPSIPAYAAAKAGLDSMMRSMAAELGGQGVTVNGIAPGYFLTELNRPLIDNQEFNAFIVKRTPAARWADPDELAGPIVLLASDAGAYINGHVLVVDGGLTAVL